MKNLSEIYEDVDSKIWADEIRHIKIRELEEIINEKSRLINDYNPTDEDYILFNKTKILNDISRLNKKLEIIKK